MHFLSLVDALLGQSVSFVLRLSAWPLSGLADDTASTHIVFCCVHNGRNLPIAGGCLVLKGASFNKLTFRKNLVGFAPFLGVPLRLVMYDVFGVGSEVVGEFNINFRVSWIFFRTIFLEFSAIFPCFCIHLTDIVCQRSCGIIVPWFPVRQGIRSSWRDCFTTAGDVPGSITPSFYCRRSAIDKVPEGCIPFYLMEFIWY